MRNLLKYFPGRCPAAALLLGLVALGPAAAVAVPAQLPNEIGSASPRELVDDRNRVAPAPKVFRTAITFSGNYSAYPGDWFHRFHPDLGLEATLRIGTGRRTWVNLAYRRLGGGTVDNRSYFEHPDDYVISTTRLRADVTGVLAGWRLNSGSLSHNIFSLELGPAFINRVATVTAPGYGSISDSDGMLGVVLQFGWLLALSRNLGLDLGLSMMHKPGFFVDDVGGTIFSFRAGVGWVSW